MIGVEDPLVLVGPGRSGQSEVAPCIAGVQEQQERIVDDQRTATVAVPETAPVQVHPDSARTGVEPVGPRQFGSCGAEPGEILAPVAGVDGAPFEERRLPQDRVFPA